MSLWNVVSLEECLLGDLPVAVHSRFIVIVVLHFAKHNFLDHALHWCNHGIERNGILMEIDVDKSTPDMDVNLFKVYFLAIQAAALEFIGVRKESIFTL